MDPKVVLAYGTEHNGHHGLSVAMQLDAAFQAVGHGQWVSFNTPNAHCRTRQDSACIDTSYLRRV